MLKNEIMKLTELKEYPEYSKDLLNNEEAINNFIEKLPTIQKIFIVQNLLKELISIKNIFLDNKKNMIKKIDNNCYKYYKNIIQIKQIFDYCESNEPEKTINYILLKDSQAEDDLHGYEEVRKNFITNFFFELRNDNNLMLKIINEIDINYYEQLGFFLTHFLYENTTNNNFFQDELMLMLFLVMEDTINNKFPNDFTHEYLIELGSEKNKYFLYYFLKNLTKKVEIRNYLTNIFHDLILDLENLNHKLIINATVIADEVLNNNDTAISRRKTMMNVKKENLNLSRANTSRMNTSRMNTYSMELVPIDLNEEKEDIIKFKSMNIEEMNFDNKVIDINSFYAENNFKKIDLSKMLSNLNNKSEEKTELENAFMEFLLFIKKEFHKEKEEIYSSEALHDSLKEIKEKKNINSTEEGKQVDEIYIHNFIIIIKFIQNLFDKILKSIDAIPYTIKCIFFLLDQLLSKKYCSEKKKISFYQILILKIKFFFGGFIIPILQNPYYNGCISDGVLSDITLENLKIISIIVQKFISGNLFKMFNGDSDPYYTIFNKFILNKMEDLFKLQVEIDKNIKKKFEPSKIIKKLIELNDIDNDNINYDFFSFNENECIQYQSVCFSFFDIIMFINTIQKENIKNYFIEKKTEIKIDYGLFVKYKNAFDKRCKKNLEENKKEFLFISNLKYKDSFLKEIKSVTEEHFENYFKNQKNNLEIKEEILAIKKCLIELMIFINKINKENFNSFIKSKENLVLNNNSYINNYFTKKKYLQYVNTSFEDSENNSISLNQINNDININKFSKTCLSCNLEEDADFLDEIFPRIITIMKNELGNNIEYKKYERIIFCITFLQINIKNLPIEYIKNNCSKLFIDIINDVQNLIKGLQNNILNQFHLKIREGDKLDIIFSKYSFQIKSMEKYYTINYIFNKITPPIPLKEDLEKEEKIKIQKSTNLSSKALSLSNKNINQSNKPNLQTHISGRSIPFFIKKFYDFKKMAEIVDDVLSIEKEEKIPDIFKKYFKDINNLVKDEKIMTKYPTNDYISICYDLENYILLKLNQKIFPIHPTKCDEFIHKKCARLNFLKPENVIMDKKMINENLLLTVTEYINKMDEKYTPVDKINMFGKAFQILQNSMTFSSGKSDLGVDDVLPLLIYVIIKAKPRMINTNYTFCKYYINPELDKKQYGFLLMQIGVVIKIISNMKYTELKDVTEEEFGVDEEIPDELKDDSKNKMNKENKG